jgi:NADH-quinone oxidoreductase subunit H
MFSSYLIYNVICVLKILLIVVPLLVSVALVTAAERKIMGGMQQRKGPNVVGPLGLLQPAADGLKLLVKETVLPTTANTATFVLAPIITFILAILAWAVIPFSLGGVLADTNLGVLYVFAVSSLGVYGIVIAGWASNSKYALLGALRSAAQMVSYEVSMGLILMTTLVVVGSLNLSIVVSHQGMVWFLIPFFPAFLMFLVSILAETNRAPFDLPEAEAELVSGYNVEYSAMGFALFFLGEYANMIFMSAMTSIFFLGGWLSLSFVSIFFVDAFFMAIKISSILFFFIWVRATFPRYRYDQLMRLGWKIFLPLSLAFVCLVCGFFFSFFLLPLEF